MKPATSISPEVQQLIISRLKIRRAAELQQQQLIKDTDIHHAGLVAKLTGLWESSQFYNLKRCGQEKSYLVCRCCGKTEEMTYRCNLKFCPRCQWRISKTREEKIRVWSRFVTQPKHLVLTQRNFPVLTTGKIREHLKNLQKFRRNEVFADVKGGCVSVEVTNSGRGWHLHSHWLIDVRFIDIQAVAIVWGKLVGQEYGIVKVKDVRDKSFVQEICKYLAKGNEIASWPPEKILEFVTAIRSRRFFFSFGSLFKQGAAIREQLKFMKPEKVNCECGERDYIFKSEVDMVLEEIRRSANQKPQRKKRPALKSNATPSPHPALFQQH